MAVHNLLASGKSRLLKRPAFTLIELLVVVALIATLSAMLFPVFAQAREKVRAGVCASNLRQIGMAFALYAQDYDDRYPYGVDPADKYTGIWGVAPATNPVLRDMPLLQYILVSYVKSEDVWRCSSDTGFDALEFHLNEDGTPVRLNARPSSFLAFGTSFFYRTELAFRQVVFPAVGYGASPPYTEHSSAEVNILHDGHGSWHGGRGLFEKRYNLLYADGHAKFTDWAGRERAWVLKLVPGP